MKPRIEIRLFGRFSFSCNGREYFDHAAIRAQEILAYSIVNRRAAVRRERLAAETSRNARPAGHKKALRQYLWKLNDELGPLRALVLRVQPEWVQFAPDPCVWVDVMEFESAARDSQRGAVAVDLYREELLSGWDHEWCEEERERLRQTYLETLDALIAECESKGDVRNGVEYANRALHNDPSREGSHRALIRFYHLSGDPRSALQQYDRCRVALRRIRVGVSDETVELVRQVRAGHGPPRTLAGPEHDHSSQQSSTTFVNRAASIARAAKGRGNGGA